MRIDVQRIKPYTICWWGAPGHVDEVYMDQREVPTVSVAVKQYNPKQ